MNIAASGGHGGDTASLEATAFASVENRPSDQPITGPDPGFEFFPIVIMKGEASKFLKPLRGLEHLARDLVYGSVFKDMSERWKDPGCQDHGATVAKVREALGQQRKLSDFGRLELIPIDARLVEMLMPARSTGLPVRFAVAWAIRLRAVLIISSGARSSACSRARVSSIPPGSRRGSNSGEATVMIREQF